MKTHPSAGAFSRLRTITLLTQDNFLLSLTCYIPRVPNGEVVLIGSATGVPQPYYRRFALFLAGKGYTVYTFDYRGMGQSRPRCLKGFEATLQQWGKLDLEAVIRYIHTGHAAAPLVYIGHSIEGQLPALTGDSKYFSRIILVASLGQPQLGSYVRGIL